MDDLTSLRRAATRQRAERIRCVDVAMRRRPADVVIRNGDLLAVRSGEILSGWGVAIAGRRFAAIGDVEDCVGPETTVVDAAGFILVPGFCDGHLHIESSRLAPEPFAAAVLPQGTTSVMEDPHEIANVIGLDGIRYFLEASSRLPLKIWTQVPSAVPPSALETAGAAITGDDAWQALSWPGVVGIGEVMTPGEVTTNARRLEGLLDAGLALRHPVEGHAAGLSGPALDAYPAAGIGSDHEVRPEDFLAKLRRGMGVQVRVGGWWARTFSETMARLRAQGVDTRSVMLVTDDRDAGDLLASGSMDYNVRQAIAEGVAPVTAIQMATINVATHFGLTQEVGEIAPGRLADLLLISDLERLEIEATIANGTLVARSGELLADLPPPLVPPYVRGTVHLPRPLRAADFAVAAPKPDGTVTVRLTSYSRPSGTADLAVERGLVQRDGANDVTKLAIVDRHSGTGRVGAGFVRGLGFTRGAAAATIAHDAHNLIVIGGSDEEMALAANRAAELDGGLVVVEGETVLAELALPVAGLMSDRPLAEVVARLSALDAAAQGLGTAPWLGESPTMILTYLSLTAANPLLITDRGLVDVKKGRPVSLFA